MLVFWEFSQNLANSFYINRKKFNWQKLQVPACKFAKKSIATHLQVLKVWIGTIREQLFSSQQLYNVAKVDRFDKLSAKEPFDFALDWTVTVNANVDAMSNE